jgi:hypothetical protein
MAHIPGHALNPDTLVDFLPPELLELLTPEALALFQDLPTYAGLRLGAGGRHFGGPDSHVLLGGEYLWDQTIPLHEGSHAVTDTNTLGGEWNHILGRLSSLFGLQNLDLSRKEKAALEESYLGYDANLGDVLAGLVTNAFGIGEGDPFAPSYMIGRWTEEPAELAQNFMQGRLNDISPAQAEMLSPLFTQDAIAANPYAHLTAEQRDWVSEVTVSNPANSFRRNANNEILLDQSTPVFRDPHDIAAEERARVRMTRAWDQLYQEFQASTASAENAFRSKFEKPKKNFLNIPPPSSGATIY